ALGMAEMFGFRFQENFRYPYIADSIKEFWRRWHISLSTWFREYLYIPLGGNRKGRARTILNKWIVFFCTGLWHGANITFVFWGLYHGFFLMLEELVHIPMKKVLRHIYVLLVVTVGFVFFRADTMTQGMTIVREMFVGFHFEGTCMNLSISQLTPLWILTAVIGILAALPVREKLMNKPWFEKSAWICSAAGLGMCILTLASGTYNPFIYFRF
ncbi:MAG: MBOAT family protein, partial [Blautia sp.]|nr:MBOAT family protein [Blautia sp.]